MVTKVGTLFRRLKQFGAQGPARANWQSWVDVEMLNYGIDFPMKINLI